MYLRFRIFITLLLLSCISVLHAQNSDDSGEQWWGYFDGSYSASVRQGMGADVEYPCSYNCAIRISSYNADIIGKRIKAVKFALPSVRNVKDIKIWMSETLPLKPELADVCCKQIEPSQLGGFDTDNIINEIPFDEPYLFGRCDLYVGYSFAITSLDEGVNEYPIFVSNTKTDRNAFFLNWGKGWNDLEGSDNGNLAIMLLTDDDGVFVKGDVNYDLKVDVGDISAAIEYVLNGKDKSFNKSTADVDGNGEINIVDVASIADIILGGTVVKGSDYDDYEEMLVKEIREGKTEILLNTKNTYKAFQIDVVLPRGEQIISVESGGALTSAHSVRYSRMSDGKYRIVVYSAAGSVLDNSDERLITINATTDDIVAENIIFATSDLKQKDLPVTYSKDTADIDDISNTKKDADVYTLGGIKVKTNKPEKGVYIVNGKKITLG